MTSQEKVEVKLVGRSKDEAVKILRRNIARKAQEKRAHAFNRTMGVPTKTTASTAETRPQNNLLAFRLKKDSAK
jgi:hypothetical protein